MQGLNPKLLAQFIDHTLLKPEATPTMIETLCREAIEHSFFAVCVNSSYVNLAKMNLKNSSVKLAAVVGFPLGAMSSTCKSFEAEWCARAGADEIDMVLHLGMLKAGDFKYVEKDIAAVVKACGVPVKVIIETALLTQEEKKLSCQLSLSAGAHFVKTSTGFNGGGATVEDIRWMRSIVGPKLGVKASGGIKSLEQAQLLIEAGATRIGTSSGIQLINGLKVGGGY